jgi:hypothetical protein
MTCVIFAARCVGVVSGLTGRAIRAIRRRRAKGKIAEFALYDPLPPGS